MLLPIIDKTEYSFDGRINTTQTIVLKERISTSEVVSAVLELRVHALSGLATLAQATVKAYPQSVSAEDPGQFFITGTAPTGSPLISIASCGPIQSTTVPPIQFAAQFSATPITSAVRIVLEWAQGTNAASGPQKITISVGLNLRMA
ncbi:MAG TPA: hypothetical protein VFB62_28010 [Polyangiaceae bacterium]|nr:hypothetical protein [Polyangiaceae bacterium]